MLLPCMEMCSNKKAVHAELKTARMTLEVFWGEDVPINSNGKKLVSCLYREGIAFTVVCYKLSIKSLRISVLATNLGRGYNM